MFRERAGVSDVRRFDSALKRLPNAFNSRRCPCGHNKACLGFEFVLQEAVGLRELHGLYFTFQSPERQYKKHLRNTPTLVQKLWNCCNVLRADLINAETWTILGADVGDAT